MIDPVIFSREIFGITLTLRWYGVIVMTGVIIGSLIAERELRRRGENGDRIWDALIWLLPVGILGDDELSAVRDDDPRCVDLES